MTAVTVSTEEWRISRSIRRHLFFGIVGIAGLLIGIAVWAATWQLEGAIIATGVTMAESELKAVQHPAGGVVGELFVRNGDHVEAGQVVVRLDDTLTRASLAIVTSQLAEAQARAARLQAEQDGSTAISFPAELMDRAEDDPQITALMESQRNLFDFRRTSREGEVAQLNERIAQLDEQARGIDAQLTAKDQDIILVNDELTRVRDLWERQLVERDRLTSLERSAAQLEGERGALVAARAQVAEQISEVELQVIQVEQDFRTEVSQQLRETLGEVSQISEQRIAAQDQLARTDIRAPQSGLVHELTVFTVGGVIGAGETIMEIVPEGDALTVEARISPADVDEVQTGQEAKVRLTALNLRTTPEIMGTVTQISPDLVTDERSGISYFVVRIALDPEQAAAIDSQIIPGMPVEAYVQTGSRTALSYLLKPFTDQIARAFRGG